ncbi:DUF5133 domain-containing protein [Streptomyces platensis]|uniref:DUF5133 domain-containing protein n=1 Tax=Streptomyces platensis TaxID=58346 RepID=UPI001F3BAE30|nr:DUF5133 domain-containing protein [Streptomyces platensis]MCF3145465.1 DUF5133 domain-containing protein [Streptomyces platensis]
MLLAHPAVLRDLLQKYEAQELLQPQGGKEAKQRMNDLAYSLCIATGTRDIDVALIAARHQLPGARLDDDSILHTPNQPAPRPR